MSGPGLWNWATSWAHSLEVSCSAWAGQERRPVELKKLPAAIPYVPMFQIGRSARFRLGVEATSLERLCRPFRLPAQLPRVTWPTWHAVHRIPPSHSSKHLDDIFPLKNTSNSNKYPLITYLNLNHFLCHFSTRLNWSRWNNRFNCWW